MLTRFKSAFYNVVGNLEPGDSGSFGPHFSRGYALPSSGGSTKSCPKEKLQKFRYSRPNFLQMNTDDEIQATADHAIRPIICPRDISKLPWNTGYAETINAGKSKRNEDQAIIYEGILHSASHISPSSSPQVPVGHNREGVEPNRDSLPPASHSVANGESVSGTLPSGGSDTVSLPYYLFGVFDGHAGWGAAVSAANQLAPIVHENLMSVVEYLLPDSNDMNLQPSLWAGREVTTTGLITGALERSFWQMDLIIGEDCAKQQVKGGCTACVALFIMGKVFVANAGDSRAVLSLGGETRPMSFDFTPETETARIRKLGAMRPELLGSEYTHLDFQRRPLRSDIGKKVLYRDHYMTGWAWKTLTYDDLKYPLVHGEGKRSRVLATIGVTRGFGDHDLKAQASSLSIKPFLTPEPEVKVFDLTSCGDLSDDDVLVLATDGLWDITDSDRAVWLVAKSLAQFPLSDAHRYKYRYTSAAQDLVMASRGKLRERMWRISDNGHATIDDITVLVIPLRPYANEQYQRVGGENEAVIGVAGKGTEGINGFEGEVACLQVGIEVGGTELQNGTEIMEEGHTDSGIGACIDTPMGNVASIEKNGTNVQHGHDGHDGASSSVDGVVQLVP